jgi:tetratricopeptide (TPR) repeat protein
MSEGSDREQQQEASIAAGGDPCADATAQLEELKGVQPASASLNELVCKPAKRYWKASGICALLVVLVFTVFGRTIGHGFVNYDDDECVYENPTVSKGLTLEGAGWAFTHAQIGHWDPLTTLTQMVDCQLYGIRPWGHHLTNVLLHAVAAVLLFVVLLEMTDALWPSGFVAALWAVHPLRMESVAWVTERKDVLSGVFFMLTLLAYSFYARRPESKLRYAMVGAVFFLGLMSKSMLVTLPFVLLLLDFWPLQRLENGLGTAGGRGTWLIVEKLPLLLLSILFAVVQIKADSGGLAGKENMSLIQRAGNAVVSYVVYLKQMVLPLDLAVLYPHPHGNLPGWEVTLAMVVLVVLSAVVISRSREQPWLATGWLWYLGMLVPVIGIVQSGELAHADRYTYLPMIGVCIAVTWAAANWAGDRRHRRVALGAVAVVILSSLSVAASHQASWWCDSITLWTHAVECTKDNSIANTDLGFALLKQGRTKEAIARYREAFRINPADVKTRINLANALLQQGRTEEAIAQYREVLKKKPDDANTRTSLGDALLQQGRAEEAIAQYRKVLKTKPDDLNIHTNLGCALFRAGRTEEAIAQYREVLRTKPDDANTSANLGLALFQQGRIEEAIGQYRGALHTKPDDANTRANLGNALLRQGQTEEAIAQYREAIRINPAFAEAHYNLGSVLFQQGRRDEAISHLRKALDLKPDNTTIRNTLAEMLASPLEDHLRR